MSNFQLVLLFYCTAANLSNLWFRQNVIKVKWRRAEFPETLQRLSCKWYNWPWRAILEQTNCKGSAGAGCQKWPCLWTDAHGTICNEKRVSGIPASYIQVSMHVHQERRSNMLLYSGDSSTLLTLRLKYPRNDPSIIQTRVDGEAPTNRSRLKCSWTWWLQLVI